VAAVPCAKLKRLQARYDEAVLSYRAAITEFHSGSPPRKFDAAQTVVKRARLVFEHSGDEMDEHIKTHRCSAPTIKSDPQF
jgi:hypothetical protein